MPSLKQAKKQRLLLRDEEIKNPDKSLESEELKQKRMIQVYTFPIGIQPGTNVILILTSFIVKKKTINMICS